jgi:hypothetical protein
MAIVRPQVIPFFEKGADCFMLDQYSLDFGSPSMNQAHLPSNICSQVKKLVQDWYNTHSKQKQPPSLIILF